MGVERGARSSCALGGRQGPATAVKSVGKPRVIGGTTGTLVHFLHSRVTTALPTETVPPRAIDGAPFDLERLLDEAADPLDLLHKHVNPALAGVLKTIGFDAKLTRGQGAYLFDESGRRYIDCLGGYAVFNVGRNHPVVNDAIRQAVAMDLPNLPGIGTFRLSGLLARELLAVAPGAGTPGALGKVFFASGGAEANDAAIKFARRATGRSRVVYCRRAYHGVTLGSLSVNGNAEFREGFGTLLPDTTEVPWNDVPALEAALTAGDVAAFIVEPIQGKGVHPPADDYFQRVAAACRAKGTLLILDEIQTGLGRTGRMWGCEHFGAGSPGPEGWMPDIMTVAKGLSGGQVPVSAVLLRDAVHARTFSSLAECSKIQTTFGMNDLAMVAGLATLHVLKHERLVEHTRDVGTHLMTGLRGMIGRHEMVREVRGKGLMVAIEFQRPERSTLRVGWDLLHKLDSSLFCQAIIMPLMSDHGIITQVAGHAMDVIKLIPPLVLSRADADEIVAGFETTVAACHRFPGPAWEVGKKLGSAALKRFG